MSYRAVFGIALASLGFAFLCLLSSILSRAWGSPGESNIDSAMWLRLAIPFIVLGLLGSSVGHSLKALEGRVKELERRLAQVSVGPGSQQT
jgi:hypothetical protein